MLDRGIFQCSGGTEELSPILWRIRKAFICLLREESLSYRLHMKDGLGDRIIFEWAEKFKIIKSNEVKNLKDN